MNFDEIVVKESPGICRCCLSEGCYKDLGTEYTWMNETEVYADMLLDCFDIGITQHNDGPNGPKRLICEVCITRLRDACNFKKQVVDSERRFIDMLGRGEFRTKVLMYPSQNKMKEESVEETPEDVMAEDVEYLEDVEYDGEEEQIKTEVQVVQSTSAASTSAGLRPKRGRPRKDDDKPEKAKKQRLAKDLNFKRIVLPIEQRRRNLEILFNNTTIIPFKHRGQCLCFFCGLKMKDRQQLVDHNQTHLPCSTKHNSLKALNGADFEIKVDVSVIQCKICSEKFSNIYNLGFHLVHKHKLSYDLGIVLGFLAYRLVDLKCLICLKQLKTLRGLIQHMNKEHPVNYFECDDCGKRFRRKHDLLGHINQRHNQEFRCPKCPVTFKTKGEYVKHKNEDHISQCNVCFQTFPSSALRLKHMKGEHDIVMGGTCGFCLKKFNSRFAFLDHAGKCSVTRYHGPANIEVSLTPIKIDIENGPVPFSSSIKTDKDMTENRPVPFSSSIKTDKDMTSPNEAETVTAMVAMREAKKLARSSIAYVFNNTTIIPFKRYHNRFRCFYCPNEFNSCNELRNHSMEEHPVCDVKLKCMKLSGLGYQYMWIKVDSSLLACKLCHDQYEDLKSLLAHLEIEHGAKLGNCAEKLLPFKLMDDQYPCPQCGVEFSHFGNTLIHFNKEHNTENRVLCVTCGESYHNLTSLQIHKNRCNVVPDRFKCTRCDLGFYNKSQLTRHLGMAHKKKVFKCPHCTESFASEHAKMVHITKEHEGGHQCTQCDASFIFRSRLIQHVRRLHLLEKNEKCPYCDKMFFDQRRLKNHMVLHTGERAFSCDYCDKTFSWKKNLISHINVHLKNAGHDNKRKERKQ